MAGSLRNSELPNSPSLNTYYINSGINFVRLFSGEQKSTPEKIREEVPRYMKPTEAYSRKVSRSESPERMDREPTWQQDQHVGDQRDDSRLRSPSPPPGRYGDRRSPDKYGDRVKSPDRQSSPDRKYPDRESSPGRRYSDGRSSPATTAQQYRDNEYDENRNSVKYRSNSAGKYGRWSLQGIQRQASPDRYDRDNYSRRRNSADGYNRHSAEKYGRRSTPEGHRRNSPERYDRNSPEKRRTPDQEKPVDTGDSRESDSKDSYRRNSTDSYQTVKIKRRDLEEIRRRYDLRYKEGGGGAGEGAEGKSSYYR